MLLQFIQYIKCIHMFIALWRNSTFSFVLLPDIKKTFQSKTNPQLPFTFVLWPLRYKSFVKIIILIIKKYLSKSKLLL